MKRKFAFCAVMVVLASSLAMAQQVSVNYNHNTNFSQYHTYAWGSNNKNAIQNSILAQVAQQDIEAAMSQKGLQKVDESQNPDLVLTASGGEREQTSYNAWGMRGIGGGMGGITPQQCRRYYGGEPVRREAEGTGVAGDRAEYAQQQREQEPEECGESRREDVQAVAEGVANESGQISLPGG